MLKNHIPAPALSKDCILRDLQHAFTAKIYDLVGEGNPYEVELNAMIEAYADYFACTQQNDPTFGEWVFKDPSGVRHLDIPKVFPHDWN